MASINDCVDDVCECAICSSIFNIPKSLPCLHTFCQDCLIQYCSYNDDLKCPICSKKFVLPNGDCRQLPTNFHLEKLTSYMKINSMEEGPKCVSCNVQAPIDGKKVCFLCNMDAQMSNMFNEKEEKDVICKEHQKTCEMYCMTCNKPVCVKCIIGSHNSDTHKLVEIEEVISLLKLSLQEALEPINKKININQGLIDNINAVKAQIESNYENMHLEILKKAQIIKNIVTVLESEISTKAKEDLQMNITKVDTLKLNLETEKRKFLCLKDRMNEQLVLPNSVQNIIKMDILKQCATDIMKRNEGNFGRIKSFKYTEENESLFINESRELIRKLLSYDTLYLKHHNMNFMPKKETKINKPVTSGTSQDNSVGKILAGKNKGKKIDSVQPQSSIPTEKIKSLLPILNAFPTLTQVRYSSMNSINITGVALIIDTIYMVAENQNRLYMYCVKTFNSIGKLNIGGKLDPCSLIAIDNNLYIYDKLICGVHKFSQSNKVVTLEIRIENILGGDLRNVNVDMAASLDKKYIYIRDPRGQISMFGTNLQMVVKWKHDRNILPLLYLKIINSGMFLALENITLVEVGIDVNRTISKKNKNDLFLECRTIVEDYRGNYLFNSGQCIYWIDKNLETISECLFTCKELIIRMHFDFEKKLLIVVGNHFISILQIN